MDAMSQTEFEIGPFSIRLLIFKIKINVVRLYSYLYDVYFLFAGISSDLSLPDFLLFIRVEKPGFM